MNSERILFLFTKHYPFGTMEKYINHEIPMLASEFGKVILVPTEYFGDTDGNKVTSDLPANVEVYLLNEEVRKKQPSAWSVLPRALLIWLFEFVHNPHRRLLIRHFNKNKNVLLYQLLSSEILSDFLKQEQFRGRELFFYSYWFHHSTLILAILRSTGIIRHFISRAHAIDLYNEDWPFAGDDHKPLPFAHYKLKYIDCVAAISEHGKAHLIKKYPGYSNKFVRSYLGVVDDGFGPEPSGTPFVIVTCSNFNPNKRLDSVTDILSKLDFKVKWVHFGAGGSGEENVKKKTEQLGPNITVEMKGYIPNTEIAEYYKLNPVNVLLNLSRVEGLPVSIMEAIGFGIPVIATSVFGTPELVSKGNGWLIDVDFVAEDVARYIAELHSRKELQRYMRQFSREVFLHNFIAEETYRNFINQLLLPSSNKF